MHCVRSLACEVILMLQPVVRPTFNQNFITWNWHTVNMGAILTRIGSWGDRTIHVESIGTIKRLRLRNVLLIREDSRDTSQASHRSRINATTGTSSMGLGFSMCSTAFFTPGLCIAQLLKARTPKL